MEDTKINTLAKLQVELNRHKNSKRGNKIFDLISKIYM